VSFLYMEESTTPMHVGGVAVFQPSDDGFDHARLVQLIKQRIAFVPRYRQRLRWVPGRLANPVWVDDESFDVTYHVRRSALPKPGSDDQLRELVGRLMSRRLDRAAAAWEVYLVEGPLGWSFAIVTKTHHAMVDGISAVGHRPGHPRRDPGAARDAGPTPGARPRAVVVRAARRRGRLTRAPARPRSVDTVRSGVTDLTVDGDPCASAPRAACSEWPARPRAAGAGHPAQPRRSASSALRHRPRPSSTTYKRIRKAHGGTVNDVVLAWLSGALRRWLQTRASRWRPARSCARWCR
jgi:WS/DGAT/MGAT family acyltransferase